VSGHAFGNQGRLEIVDGVASHRALTRESLGVPKGRPARWLLVTECLDAPADGDRVDDLRDPVVGLQVLGYTCVVDDGGVELLELAFVLENAAGVVALRGKVPGGSSGGDLGTDVRNAGGSIFFDGDTQFLFDDAEPSLTLGLL